MMPVSFRRLIFAAVLIACCGFFAIANSDEGATVAPPEVAATDASNSAAVADDVKATAAKETDGQKPEAVDEVEAAAKATEAAQSDGSESTKESTADVQSVHELSAENFTTFIDGKYVLVKFYAPWCGHCKALEKPYSEAAERVKSLQEPVFFAKIDATINTALAKDFEITGYPTLKFFRKSTKESIDYNSGRSADDMVEWVSKKIGPPVVPLKTLADYQQFKELNPIAVYGYFGAEVAEDAAEYSIYKQVADHFGTFKFAVLLGEQLLSEFKVEAEKFAVVEANGERHVYSATSDVASDGQWTTSHLKRFVGIFSSPRVVEFGHETAQAIFGNEIQNHTMLFLSRSANHYDRLAEFEPVVEKFRGRFMFVSLDADVKDHQRIVEYLGVKVESCPTVRIVKFTDENMFKYGLLEDELSVANLELSLTRFLEGKMEPMIMSQDIPSDWDQTLVKVLVANNFEQALDRLKKPDEEGLHYMLVEFYAPWCGHCKQLEPIYNKLAEAPEFKDSEEYWIAKMDATTNEVPTARINSFPTIRLYYRDQTGELQQKEYNGHRSFTSLKQFLLTHGESSDDDADSEPADQEESETEKRAQKDEL